MQALSPACDVVVPPLFLCLFIVHEKELYESIFQRNNYIVV